MTDEKKFDEKKESYELALFLKHQCRIDEKELQELISEFFDALNDYKTADIEVFFDNALYRREMKAYRYVALQKLYDYYKEVVKIRDYDVFRELEKAIRDINSNF